MKKAAVVMLFLAGVTFVAGGSGRLDSVGNFVADVQAKSETESEEEPEEADESERKDRVVQIDTSVPIEAGSWIAVVSKAVDGEFWKLVRHGMEDAVEDINKAYEFSSNDELTMTFEGASDEEDIETQVNTLDAVIAENPTAVCLSAGDIASCQAQLEAAMENGIPTVVFDSNVNEDELVSAFRGTDNVYVGQLAGKKLAEAIGESGKVAIFSAQEKTESSQKRVEGFKTAMTEYPDIAIVRTIYSDKVEDMSAVMTDVLTRYPDLDGVFCSNGDVADLYLEIEKEENQPIMIGVDATTAQQEAIKAGTEFGAVSQDPYEMGYQTILTAVQAMSSDEETAEAVAKNILLEPKWIDVSNIEAPESANYLYQ